MSGSKTGMAPLFDVARRSAKPADKKIAEALLGGGKVVGRIHRPENVVVRNAAIKRRREAVKSLFADERVDVELLHVQRELIAPTGRREPSSAQV